ncbi:MAG: hypothetical protein H8D56_25570 [Planctomycetes bacterium]|nr:hypothetical protein [Planctomycetota bacterium]
MIKPVKRILMSSKDKLNLYTALEIKKMRQEEQPKDYKGRIVIKPWGYEFLIFENDSVAIWFLYIKKDHSTSMHCHPSKKTSLTLLSGRALCNTFGHRNFLSTGDSLNIDSAVFHSTKSFSLDGVSLIEVETPPGKLDLVRLEDSYGREDCGYEGCSQMVTENLDSFNYFYIEEKDCQGQKITVDNRFSISMESYLSNKEFQNSFTLDPGGLYCICKGALFGPNKSTVVDVGETEKGSYLCQFRGLGINNETILMKFTVFD